MYKFSITIIFQHLLDPMGFSSLASATPCLCVSVLCFHHRTALPFVGSVSTLFCVISSCFTIYVFVHSGNGKLATWGCIIGFVVMMCLDVGLG